MGFAEGDMLASDYQANKAAVFHPAVNASDNNGTYAPPCVEVSGVQVYAYVRDGILVVSLDYAGADTSKTSPFALYGEGRIPAVFTAGDDGSGLPDWVELPDDAASEADARLIRAHCDDTPDEWPSFVVPAWVYSD